MFKKTGRLCLPRDPNSCRRPPVAAIFNAKTLQHFQGCPHVKQRCCARVNSQLLIPSTTYVEDFETRWSLPGTTPSFWLQGTASVAGACACLSVSLFLWVCLLGCKEEAVGHTVLSVTPVQIQRNPTGCREINLDLQKHNFSSVAELTSLKVVWKLVRNQ